MALEIPFDPVERGRAVEAAVMRGEKRKYYRFRASKYYGGIATADAVGCCFLCAYCWNYWRNLNPDEARGEFLGPREVSRRLLRICERKGETKVRISGAEPVLGDRSFEHVVDVIRRISSRNPFLDFILETNGFFLGFNPEFAKELSGFRRLFVRVSIKGWDEESFERITGARGEFFHYPIEAIRILRDSGVYAWPAVMMEIFRGQGIEELGKVLKKRGISLEEMEVEYLEAYPFVIENMKKRGIKLNGGIE